MCAWLERSSTFYNQIDKILTDVQSAGPTCKGRMELDLWHNTTSYMKGLIHAGIVDWREYGGLSW